MVKIGYRENLNELENLYRGSITPVDRFVFSTIKVKKTIFTKKALKGITQKSLLPEIANLWNQVGAGDRNMWDACYTEYFKNGFRAFTKAVVQMRKAGLSGMPDYNYNYLGKVGLCRIEAPANRLHIKQSHPNDYYVMKKVKGTKSQYSPQVVYEFATFPILFKISYKSNLTSLSSNSYARIYIRVYTDYQGRRLETDYVFPINLIQDWNRVSYNIDKPLGTFKGYEMHIDLYDVRGDVYFDNLYIYHTGKNWARDPHFENMRTTYTRKYYQIASHYDIIDLPEGASFNSIYYE